MQTIDDREDVLSEPYKFDDKYLFIGLTTGAIKNENGAFVKHGKKLFEFNKIQINRGLKSSSKILKDYYKPIVFNVFGDYDFAFFGLSDSYQFGAKNFRPYSISIEDFEKEKSEFELPFQYQCFYGPHPYKEESERLSFDLLEKLEAKKCFSLCQIKLNNALVIGGGKNFLRDTIYRIKDILDKEDILYNLSLSFSWHEITLSCFAEDYVTLFHAINKIRHCELDDLSMKKWYANSLHHSFNEIDSKDPIAFIKVTNTKFGYKYDEDPDEQQRIIKEINDLNNKKCASCAILKEIRFVSRIHAKPERVKDLYSLLKKSYTDFDAKFNPRLVSGRSVLNLSTSELCNIFLHGKIIEHKYLRKISTFLEFYVDSDETEYEKHTGLQDKVFGSLEFGLKRIDAVKQLCHDLRFPKITTERVIRLMINFNRNINDPAIFSYFLELEGPIEYLIRLIENSKEKYDLYKQVSILIDEIEKAYNTRFYHTPQFIYAGDTSTEYSGGILQIITGYDFAVKVLANLLYSNDKVFESYNFDSHFVNLTPSTGIDSKEKSVRLNFYHLFQPALVATSLMHECFNYFTDLLSQDYKNVLGIFPYKDVDDTEWTTEALINFLNEYCDLYIYFHEDFTDGNHNTDESKAFYFALSPNKLRTLIIDFIVWKYAYKEESILFLYWHFGAILQKTSFYNKDAEPHADDAIQLSTRFYLLSALISKLTDQGLDIKSFDDTYLEKSLMSVFGQVEYPYNAKTMEEAQSDLKIVSNKFIDVVFNMNAKYRSHINDILEMSSSLKEEIKDFGFDIDTITFRELEVVTEPMMDLDKMVKEDIQKNKILDSLMNLKPFILALSDCEDCIKENKYAETIIDTLFNHLKEVKDLTTLKKDQEKFNFDQFVLRNDKDNIEDGAGIMFNPQGGVFTTECEIRKELLKLNSDFYFDLWHLAQTHKKTILEELYQERMN